MHRTVVAFGAMIALLGCGSGNGTSGTGGHGGSSSGTMASSSSSGTTGSSSSSTSASSSSGSACGAGADACSTCISNNCCANSMACGAEAGCAMDLPCMFTCTGAVSACVTMCNTNNNATFTAYGACVSSHCATECKK